MKRINKILTTLLIILFITGAIVMPVAAQTPCPKASANSTDCITGGFGFDQIDLSKFFPVLSLNDLVGTVMTLILIVLVVIFGFKIAAAGFKFINNDSQDKSKKDAAKSMINGSIGLALAFGAYFIVLFIRSFFGGGDEQLVKCGLIMYRNADEAAVVLSPTTSSVTQAPDDFKRCIAASGKEAVMSNPANYTKFRIGAAQCGVLYVNPVPSTTGGNTNLEIKDAGKLQQCIADVIKGL